MAVRQLEGVSDTRRCTPEAVRLRHLLAHARLRVLAEAETAGVRHIAVVGSVARGDAEAGSDIDLLVDVDDEVSLFELAELRKSLERLLGVSIDIIERAGVSIGLEHLEGEAITL